jgi:IclR family acetate operon transcriptional repressor
MQISDQNLEFIIQYMKWCPSQMTLQPSPAGNQLELPDGRTEAGALRRALALLDAVFAAGRALSLAEISDLAGLNASTSHRLLGTLAQCGYVYRDSSKRYLPGGKMLNPLGVYHPLATLRRSAAQIIRGLRDSTGLTSVLVLILGQERIVLDMLPGTDPFSLYYDTRLTTPLHASVSGKLLLAHMAERERDKLLQNEPYEARAPLTITRRDALEAELARVLREGYAETRDEVFDGMAGVGAPILLGPNRLAGVVVLSGPTSHFTEDCTLEIARLTRRAAELFAHASPDLRAVARFLGI